MKEKNNNLIVHHAVIGLLLVIITVLATYFIVDIKAKQISEKVIAGMLKIEYDKVGGMDNYVKINEITKAQVIEGLKQYDANEGAQAQPQAQAKVDSNTSFTVSPYFAGIDKQTNKDGVHILGNPDADITFVEYSDLECPFCKKLHDAGTIEQILKEYDGKVNFIFKQFPLNFHPQAPMEAEAALCVGDLAGAETYYNFIANVFANSKANGRSYTKETVSDLGAELGVDKQELLSCISSGKFKQRAQDELNEGKDLYGITGTPGNVLINNKTGDWDKLPGAYPYASFKEKIDVLLKK